MEKVEEKKEQIFFTVGIKVHDITISWFMFDDFDTPSQMPYFCLESVLKIAEKSKTVVSVFAEDNGHEIRLECVEADQDLKKPSIDLKPLYSIESVSAFINEAVAILKASSNGETPENMKLFEHYHTNYEEDVMEKALCFLNAVNKKVNHDNFTRAVLTGKAIRRRNTF